MILTSLFLSSVGWNRSGKVLIIDKPAKKKYRSLSSMSDVRNDNVRVLEIDMQT